MAHLKVANAYLDGFSVCKKMAFRILGMILGSLRMISRRLRKIFSVPKSLPILLGKLSGLRDMALKLIKEDSKLNIRRINNAWINNITNGNNERITWSLNFEGEFPGVASVLGFTNAEMTALLQDSAAMRHAILFSQAGAVFSKACTAFKNGMLGGVGENQLTPDATTFTAPADPPADVDAGIIERLSKAMNTAKLSSGYTQTIGETLMIANAEPPSFNPDDAKPSATTTSLTGSIVRIDWKKGKFDGIFIDTQRNDETDWTRLDFDMRSPYERHAAARRPQQTRRTPLPPALLHRQHRHRPILRRNRRHHTTVIGGHRNGSIINRRTLCNRIWNDLRLGNVGGNRPRNSMSSQTRHCS